MSDFKKLDSFMSEHKPQLGAALPLTQTQSKKLIPWFSLAAITAALAIFLTTQATQEPLYMESLYVAESIEWEVEEDSLLSYYDVL